MLKGSIGTVSHGTLRPQDLLKAFADELERLAPPNNEALYGLIGEARVMLRVWDDGPITDSDAEYCGEVIQSLMDALQDCAPDGCYFGAHEGDGSDFGFWPFTDSED